MDRMECRVIDENVELFFLISERDTANLVELAYGKSDAVIQELWKLPKPARFRLYVMTSWFSFYLHSAPWHLKILLLLLMPIIFQRDMKIWKLSGGVSLLYKSRPAVAIKPPHLIQASDRRIGELLYVEEPDVARKVEHIVCHEMTHMYSAFLKLPMWLNEGIAMISVDKFFGKRLLKEETLKLINQCSQNKKPQGYRQLSGMSLENIAYHYARGYWIVKYLNEKFPDLLKKMFRKKQSSRIIDREIAAALNLKSDELWKSIDEIILQYFNELTH